MNGSKIRTRWNMKSTWEKLVKLSSEGSVLDRHSEGMFWPQNIDVFKWIEFQGVMLYAAYKMKYPQHNLF